MQEIKKVVAIGPESTGKSSLCRFLADYYQTLWCPEYARKFLLTNGTNYDFDDLLVIAEGQLQLEEKYLKRFASKEIQGPIFFVDTDMYVMKVWCEFVFGKCHQFILEEIVKSKTDLYLLCNTDLPWVKDELREYPDLKSREELYHMYKDILVNQRVPFVEISGNYKERQEKAITAVEALFS